MKILFIAALNTYKSQSSLTRFHFLRFLQEKKHIVVHNYDRNISLRNILTYYPGWNFDRIIFHVIRPTGHKSCDVLNAAKDTWKYPTILMVEDIYHTERIISCVQRYGFGGLILSVKNFKIKTTLKRALPDRKIYALDPFFDDRVFKNYQLPKKYDVILYGSSVGSVYPLRERVFRIVQSLSTKFKVHRIPFPGYRLSSRHVVTKSLARMLNESYFSVATQSKYGFFVKKYLEIPSCNCTLIGDLPSEYSQVIPKKHMVYVTNEMSDQEIHDEILAAIAVKEKFAEINKEQMKRIPQNFGFEATYHKILRALTEPPVIIPPNKVPRRLTDSATYWERRYARGGHSGSGSYNHLGAFKAEVVNSFLRENDIHSVIDFGCGDGNQLSQFNCAKYIGLDISPTIIRHCKKKFLPDQTKQFFVYNSSVLQNRPEVFKSELGLSLDVIFLLTEDDVFEKYMKSLFEFSSRFVIIYSSNFDKERIKHERDRKFTNWIEQNQRNWKLLKMINNKFKYNPADPGNTSKCDFYIYIKE